MILNKIVIYVKNIQLRSFDENIKREKYIGTPLKYYFEDVGI